MSIGASSTTPTTAQGLLAAVVVDPYSSGKYLLIELERRGLSIIAVRSSSKLGTQFLKSHDANQRFFAECFEFENCNDVALLTAKINALPYEVIGVFGGSEPGVELADRLAEALGMRARNKLDLLEARKDKAEMQDALRRNGLPAAEQFKSGHLEELLKWARCRNQWPLVAKPVGGAGSDGVFFCKSLEDVCHAHENIIGATNPTGVVNNEIALQEFLQGDEYIVDTVSHDGKHLCVAIWVYTKRRGLPWDPNAIIASQNELLPPSGEVQEQLIDYVFSVLDAVGLRYGPCHTEVMFTARGPVLVEVNARMHGLQGPLLIELATGTNKATYTADAIIDGGALCDKLLALAQPGRYMYPMSKHCVQVVLCSGVQGYLCGCIKKSIADMNLPSVIDILPAVEQGGYISRTRDLGSSAGSVLMVHDSMEQIKEDVRRIREKEEDGSLYPRIEPPEAEEAIELMRPWRRAYSDAEEESVEGVKAREHIASHLESMKKAEELWTSMNGR